MKYCDFPLPLFVLFLFICCCFFVLVIFLFIDVVIVVVIVVVVAGAVVLKRSYKDFAFKMKKWRKKCGHSTIHLLLNQNEKSCSILQRLLLYIIVFK